MKNTSRHTGILEVIERAPSSRNGNPRYVVRLDGITARTGVNSSLGYSITNYNGDLVTADIGTVRGTVTIKNVEVSK